MTSLPSGSACSATASRIVRVTRSTESDPTMPVAGVAFGGLDQDVEVAEILAPIASTTPASRRPRRHEHGADAPADAVDRNAQEPDLTHGQSLSDASPGDKARGGARR